MIRYFIAKHGQIAHSWNAGASSREGHESTLRVVQRLTGGNAGIVALTREQFDAWQDRTGAFAILGAA